MQSGGFYATRPNRKALVLYIVRYSNIVMVTR